MLLKAKDVSTQLSISLSSVYAYADAGLLKAIYLPPVRPSKALKRNKPTIRFRVEDVEAFLHNCNGWS